VVAEEADPDAEAPALDEVDPPPECVVVVCPLMAVEEDTLPPPAVTDDERPLPVVAPWSLF
jgi:hypothetical protein